MKCFKKNIGENGAEATFYLQEPNKEIDINRKSPVMIVVPGGAYMWTSWREEEPIALEFLGKGFSCIVAQYATEGLSFYDGKHDYSKEPVSAFPNPLVDLAKIVAYVRENAEKWDLDCNSINVIGFSAGGNLTAQLGVYWNTDWLEKLVEKPRKEYQPNSICLSYGAPHMAKTPEKDRYRQTKKMGGPNMIDYATLGNDQSEERVRLVNMVDTVSSIVYHQLLSGTQWKILMFQ
ncbi:alpha/beta hydrolase [Lactobacillus paragasseri]|uniref:alpha/beta hydrolase n=1 Tax=Lactobacillus paragasseri TaxID=2107999 RepID=UPI002072B159|nr:alpha/beta hydrolase [Lactobacillus paragasseri]